MKKIISLVAIAAMMLAMAGCAVNANTGAIVVNNYTTKAANNVKVGSIFIGHVAAGETKTVYFFSEQTAAPITAEGFSAGTGLNGTIDLKKNYNYHFTFQSYTTGDTFSVNGIKIGYNATSPATDDIIGMK